MPWTTKVLVIANRTIESEEIRDALVSRAGAGPLEVTLVAPESSGAGSRAAVRPATAERCNERCSSYDRPSTCRAAERGSPERA
jgi:hypothetical protein